MEGRWNSIHDFIAGTEVGTIKEENEEKALKKYIEVGFGNRWFIRTEVENEDGTETEIKGFIKPFQLKSIYLRIWVGRKVLIIDSREGVKTSTKGTKKVKVVIGFYGL